MTDAEKAQQEHSWDRWFRRTRKEFTPLLLPFSGKPVTYVEIGCWAGACAEWVAMNVLKTHPESQGFGIDPYWPDKPKHPVDRIKQRAAERIAATGVKWTWIYQPSTTGLIALRPLLGQQTIDVLYIDGDHSGHGVVQDFALAWPMLRPGSVVIFDDWLVRRSHAEPHVVQAVEAIRLAWGDLVAPTGQRHHRQASLWVVKKKR